jgi:hypothetical protein
LGAAQPAWSGVLSTALENALSFNSGFAMTK